MKHLLLLSSFLILTLISNAQLIRVAILDFENISGIAKYDGLGKAMSSMLISDIESNVSPKRLQLVERAQIQKILKEQNFQSTGSVNKSTAVKTGKILGVNYLLVGDVYILNDQLIINARLTNTETGDIVFSKKQEGKTANWLTLKTVIAKELAVSLSQPFSVPTIPDKEIPVATITTFGNAIAAKDTGNVQMAETLSSTVVDFNPEFKYIDDLRKEIDELKKQINQNTKDIVSLKSSGDLVIDASSLEEFENNLKSDLLSKEKKFDVFIGMIKKHADLIVNNSPKYGQYGYEIDFNKFIVFENLDFIDKQLNEADNLTSINQKIMLLGLVRGELSLLILKCTNPKAYNMDFEEAKLSQSIILLKKCLLKLQPLKFPNISTEELFFNEIIIPFSLYEFFNVDSKDLIIIKKEIYNDLILKLNSKYSLDKRICDVLIEYSKNRIIENKFYYLILFIYFNEIQKNNKGHEIFKLNLQTDLWSKQKIYTQIKREYFELPLIIDEHGVRFNDNLNKSEVIIGNQIWMTKNLNVDQFQNGDKISQAKTFEEWNSLAQKGEAAWCYFNFNENNAQEFGKIYNWFAIIDKRLLAPKGWHIPSLSEWNSFSYQIGGCFSENSDSLYLCLSKIKKQGAWNDSKFRSPSTNESGFSAIPCGKINVSKSGGNLIYNFENNRDLVFWWSSTWSQEYSEVINNSVKYDLNSSANIIRLGENFSKGWSYISEGMYVRCVKD